MVVSSFGVEVDDNLVSFFFQPSFVTSYFLLA